MVGRLRAENIRLKRAYERPSQTDGVRVLVERLWPRGLRTTEARFDRWAKDIAPSTGLRNWFGHDPERWEEFRRRYANELDQHPEEVRALRRLARVGPVTFVYSARDESHNSAIVLRQFLLSRIPHPHVKRAG